MSFTSPEQQSVKAAVDALIQAGTTFDLEALERIYHDDMTVTMVNQDGLIGEANKEAFKGMFAAKKSEGAAPLNTWSDYRLINVNGSKAHVVIMRKVNLVGADELLTLSIDLVEQDGRWQVTREVIFHRPDPDAA